MDVIASIECDKYALGEFLNQLLTDLMKGIQEEISNHKKRLDPRSKKEKYPTILWTLNPLHSEFSKDWDRSKTKFNECLQNLVPTFSGMAILKLLQFWNAEDTNLLAMVY